MNYIEPIKIATDFDKELRGIKTKFLHADYPVKFINHKRRPVNTEMVI